MSESFEQYAQYMKTDIEPQMVHFEPSQEKSGQSGIPAPKFYWLVVKILWFTGAVVKRLQAGSRAGAPQPGTRRRAYCHS